MVIVSEGHALLRSAMCYNAGYKHPAPPEQSAL